MILRPGAIVGPGKTWGYGAAFGIGRLAFVVAPRAQFRFVSLSNCAEAIVKAVDADVEDVQVVNLVDDEAADARRVLPALRTRRACRVVRSYRCRGCC